MKINQNVPFLNKATSPAAVSAPRAGAPAGAPAGAAPAARAATLPSTNGDFDAARVARIRESISAGRYQINAANIADGLLSSVHDLIQSTPHD